MDRLKTMESFVRVARSGSFSVAAGQIGCSRALVTKHVMELEARLGARLLNRTTRKLALTEIGGEYFEFCNRILALLDQEGAVVAHLQNEPRGLLRILAPKSFGSMHFADCVSTFALAYPRIAISLILDDSSGRSVNFAQSQCDVMIRLVPLRDSSVIAQKIGTLAWVLCASPAYLKMQGEPRAPQDLAQANCLVHPKLAPDRIWHFGGQKKECAVKVSGSFSSNSVVVLRRATLAGVGIAQLPLYRVAADLESGALIRLLPSVEIPDRPIYAIFPDAKLVPEKVKVFVRFLARWYKTACPVKLNFSDER